MMGGVGAVVVSIFGIFWTVMAANMGAPFFFPQFGVVFVLLGVAQAIYHFRNATGEDRHSLYDITDESEEQDPFSRRFGRPQSGQPRTPQGERGSYCPYCGAQTQGDHSFCRQCGRRLE